MNENNFRYNRSVFIFARQNCRILIFNYFITYIRSSLPERESLTKVGHPLLLAGNVGRADVQ